MTYYLAVQEQQNEHPITQEAIGFLWPIGLGLVASVAAIVALKVTVVALEKNHIKMEKKITTLEKAIADNEKKGVVEIRDLIETSLGKMSDNLLEKIDAKFQLFGKDQSYAEKAHKDLCDTVTKINTKIHQQQQAYSQLLKQLTAMGIDVYIVGNSKDRRTYNTQED